jgi:hypothetical protein
MPAARPPSRCARARGAALTTADTDERRMRTAPSGKDTLRVRQEYLRRHRLRQAGAWHRTAASMLLGGIACCLCIAGFAVFVFGS